MSNERRSIAHWLARSASSLAVAGVASTVFAATVDERAEQLRIHSERSAANANFAARVRECEQRFVITPCVEDAKRDRRHAVDALKARQLQLDEVRRRERTSERRAELAAKAAEDAEREQTRAARPPSPASAPAREPLGRSLEPRRPQAASGVAHAASQGRQDRRGHGFGIQPSKSASIEQRRSREERSEASFEVRQQQAAEHRAEVLGKAAQRAKGKAPAMSLPMPSAPAAASTSTP